MKLDKLFQYKKQEQLVLLCSRSAFDKEAEEYAKEIVSSPGFNWYEFLGISMINRVNGVVYKNIKDLKGVPKYVKYFLKVAFLEQKERTTIHRNEIIKISKIFEKNNIRHAFLKGAVLNTVIYNPGERISNDTDVMVYIDDIEKTVDLLKQEGYLQGTVKDGLFVPATKKEILFARLNTYEIVPLNKPLDARFLPFHEIDINFRLGNDSTPEEAKNLLENTVKIGEEYGIRTLFMEDFLLFMCIHHYREAIMVYKIVRGDDLTLYKFMDIHFILTSQYKNIDWNVLREKVEKMNRFKDVYYTLYYTEQLYPGTISEEHLNMFKPADTAFLNEYRGKDNSDEVYTWKTDFVHRVFSYDRQIEALENIGDENERFKQIKASVKGQCE